jgi:pyrophosphatase PpaX
VKIKAVIFDFDQVIAKSYADHVLAFLHASEKMGLGLKKNEIYARFGKSARDIMREIRPTMSEREISQFVRIKDAYYRKKARRDGVKRMPGVIQLLRFLDESGTKIGIASSASKENIAIGLRSMKLGVKFESIVGAENVKRHKPDPELLFKSAKALGARPADCAYVGDSENEMIAAKRAGMFGVGITSGVFTKNQLMRRGGRAVFRSHAEILRFFRKHIKR